VHLPLVKVSLTMVLLWS